MNFMAISLVDQAIRIAVAIVVGGIIGLERKRKNKVAGVKTHITVCIITTMLTMTSAYGFNHLVEAGMIDPTRLIANITTAVGFLAGGAIYVTHKNFDRSEESVVGLTTAASVFGAAMLGIPIGVGHFPLVAFTVIGIEIGLQSEKVLRRIGLLRTNNGRKDED